MAGTIAGMTARKTLLAAAALLASSWGPATTVPRAQIPVGAPERVMTPDGSVFVLLKRPSRGIVWWASFIRMGAKHESAAQMGLAEACARSSLAGTTTHGTSAPAAESEARENLDKLRSALHEGQLAGRADGGLAAVRKDIEDALARVRNLSNPFAFRRILSGIPATPPKITCSADGYLLEASLPSDRLDDFAILMFGRRKDAMLRGYHDELARIRQRLRAESEAPGAMHRRALCLAALEVDPLRRVLLAPNPGAPHVTRASALQFYRKHHRGVRTTTVLVGDFDPESVKAMLAKTFVDARGASGPRREFAIEPAQNGPRSRVLNSSEARLLWAWRPPADARPDALRVLATWLERRLESEFVRERALASWVRVSPRFPSLSAPSPFTVELAANSAYDFRQLEIAAQQHLREIERNGPPADEVGVAALSVLTEIRGTFEDPARTAASIANSVGRHPTRSLPSTVDTLAATAALSRVLFSESKRTTVTTRPEAKDGDGR